MQLSKIIVGNLVIIAVVVGIFTFISDGINQYGAVAPDGYNESFTKIANTQTELLGNLNQTYEDLNNVDSSTTAGGSNTDFLGFFFSAGYTAARTAIASISGTNTMVDVAIGSLPLGNYGQVLKSLFLMGILAVIVVGILLNFIIKSGRE